MGYVAQYIQDATKILSLLDQSAIERTADLLLELRERSGRCEGDGDDKENHIQMTHEVRAPPQVFPPFA